MLPGVTVIMWPLLHKGLFFLFLFLVDCTIRQFVFFSLFTILGRVMCNQCQTTAVEVPSVCVRYCSFVIT